MRAAPSAAQCALQLRAFLAHTVEPSTLLAHLWEEEEEEEGPVQRTQQQQQLAGSRASPWEQGVWAGAWALGSSAAGPG